MKEFDEAFPPGNYNVWIIRRKDQSIKSATPVLRLVTVRDGVIIRLETTLEAAQRYCQNLLANES